MLEFLFDFLERNIVLVFVCVMFLGIASAYSKGMKFLFLSILGIAMTYFALLCFYRLGYGFEGLYQWSCNIVLRICYYIDYYSIFCFSHSFIITKIMEGILHQSPSNMTLYIFHILASITFVIIVIAIIVPKVRILFRNTIQINMKDINKITIKYDTNNRVQAKYILNSVFRC